MTNPSLDPDIDEAILSVAWLRWRKVAMVIYEAREIIGNKLPEGDLGWKLISDRIEALVAAGHLLAKGNTKNWRHSEVRKPDGTDDGAQQTHFLHLSAVDLYRVDVGKAYLEFLRVPAMSAGLYVIPRGGSDPQRPHREDEVYYVVRGRARMTVGRNTRSVTQGRVIFVPAGVEHRFHDIEEELAVLVVFAPAESP